MRGRRANARGGVQNDSLMARLAELETGPQPTIRTRPRTMQRYFGLGLLGSGLAGCAAIVALPYFTGEPMRDGAVAASSAIAQASSKPHSKSPSRESVTRTAAASPGSPPAKSADRVPAAEPPGPPPPLNMTLTRGGRGMSPFPLQVSNIADPDNARVILHDMPKTTRLTNGERRDNHTWALRLADLPNLQVSLGEGTPEVFDVGIEIASSTGAQILKTSVRVRLKPGDGHAAPRRLPKSIEDLLRESKAKIPPTAVETPFRTEVTSVSPPEAPSHLADPSAVAQAADASAPPSRAAEAEPKPLPEGLSALGGPLNRPEAANRQVWWKLPTPSQTPEWAPFGNPSSR